MQSAQRAREGKCVGEQERYAGQCANLINCVKLTSLSSLGCTVLETHLPCSSEVFLAGKPDSWVGKRIRHTERNLQLNVPHC